MPTPTRLKVVLRSEGRSQRWLAEQIGMHETHLSRIVNGLHADHDTRTKIAKALGKTENDLWPNLSEAA